MIQFLANLIVYTCLGGVVIIIVASVVSVLAKLKVSAEPLQLPVAPPAEKELVCRYCGHPLSSVVCNYCGAWNQAGEAA